MSAQPHRPRKRLALLRELEREIAEKTPERLGTLAAIRSLIIDTEAELAAEEVDEPEAPDRAA